MRWRSKAAFFDTVFVNVKFSGFCFRLCLIVGFDPKSHLNIGSFFFLFSVGKSNVGHDWLGISYGTCVFEELLNTGAYLMKACLPLFPL